MLKLTRCDNKVFGSRDVRIDSSQAIFPIIAKGAVFWRDLEDWTLTHFQESRELLFGEGLRMSTRKMGAVGNRFVECGMGTEDTAPLLAMVFEFVRKPCLSIRKELELTLFVCTDIWLEI